MKNIVNVITYETINRNENEFYDTIDMVYSVNYDDGSIDEFFNNNVPDEILDFIDFAELYNETYNDITEANSNETRERIYFKK